MRLSMMITGAICVAGTLAIATPTLAQSQTGSSTYNPRRMTTTRTTADEYRRGAEFDSQRLGDAEEMTPEEAEAAYGAERVALAERVQALMDAGQCTEARRVASEAGERAMALRVRQTCRRR